MSGGPCCPLWPLLTTVGTSLINPKFSGHLVKCVGQLLILSSIVQWLCIVYLLSITVPVSQTIGLVA